MPSAKDVKPDSTFLKAFVCGDSGTGKSVFAGTFPKPIYLFNFDDAILSYMGLDVEYEDYPLSAQGWVKFEKDFNALRKLAKDDEFPYKTVVIDSITSWSDIAMERALSLDPKRSPTGGPMWNVHYGMVKNLLEGKVRQLLDLPANIVVIGHLTKLTDGETGSIIGIEPMLTGQLSAKVPAYFDEVYYATNKLVQGQTQFKLLTLAHGHMKARSRLSGVKQILPKEVDNNYNTIMEIIRKQY